MSDMKKVNLKAKKLTQMTYYNSKGKYVLSKWEDVDPTKVLKLFNKDVNGVGPTSCKPDG